MLILSRNYGESIIVADNIKITFLGMNGLQAKIGFEAPQEVDH